jgi:hypothetical protein
MNFLQRMNATLHHQPADQVPFAPNSELIPRGDFEREMRNRGMGMLLKSTVVWSEMPDVSVEYRQEGDTLVTLYHTPEGTVSTRDRIHLGRISQAGDVRLEWLIKGPEDYDPTIFMIENTVFHPGYNTFLNDVRDMGTDGIVRAHGHLWPPYDYAEKFIGLVNWVMHQQDYPDRFWELVAALDRQAERLVPLLADSPAELISFGWLRTHRYGPESFARHVLPSFEKYLPILKAKGKLCNIHADDARLKPFVQLVRQSGIDIVEAYTPPPFSDLEIEDARAAWGDDTIIWINFPETIYWHGPDATREYTLDLLRRDPCPDALIIGVTEMGTFGITNDETERAFKDGMRAVMDAIEQFGAPRRGGHGRAAPTESCR